MDDRTLLVEAKRRLGQRMKQAAAAAKLDAATLAKEMELQHVTTIYKWWGGEDCPQLHKVQRYADLTGRPVGWFYDPVWGNDVAQEAAEVLTDLCQAVLNGKGLGEAFDAATAEPEWLSPAIRRDLDAGDAAVRERLHEWIENHAPKPWGKLDFRERREIVGTLARFFLGAAGGEAPPPDERAGRRGSKPRRRS